MRRGIFLLSRGRGSVGLWNYREVSCCEVPIVQNGIGGMLNGKNQGWLHGQRLERGVHSQNPVGNADDGVHPEDKGAHMMDFEHELLERALGHVETCGWSHKALQQSALELNLSKAAAGAIADGPARLILLSMSMSNRAALETLEKEAIGFERKDQVKWLSRCLRVRLEITGHLTGHIPGAARILTNPKHAWEAAKLVHEFIDAIWRLSGDRSMDLTWYPKRAALAGIFSGAQVHMATDFSPGFTDTWKFIDDKIENMLQAQSSASDGPAAWRSLAQNVQQTMKKHLGFMNTS